MSDQSFPKAVRVVHQQDFDRVHAGDSFAADKTLVVKAVLSGRPVTRLGLSVGRKTGNAVCRNRWKRLIRESFRRQKDRIPKGWDVVVRPRKGAECQFEEIYKSLPKLICQIDRRFRRKRDS